MCGSTILGKISRNLEHGVILVLVCCIARLIVVYELTDVVAADWGESSRIPLTATLGLDKQVRGDQMWGYLLQVYTHHRSVVPIMGVTVGQDGVHEVVAAR